MSTEPIAEDVYCPKHGTLCYPTESGAQCPLCDPLQKTSASAGEPPTPDLGVEAYCEGRFEHHVLIDTAAESGRRWGAGRVTGDGRIEVNFGALDSNLLVFEQSPGAPDYILIVKDSAHWTRDLLKLFDVASDGAPASTKSASVRTVRPAMGRRISVTRIELDTRGEVRLTAKPVADPAVRSRSGSIQKPETMPVSEPHPVTLGASITPQSHPKQKLVLSGLAAVAVIASLWFISYNSIGSRIDRAIAAHNLFGPGGALAIYYEGQAAGSAGLPEARNKLRPQFEAFGNQAFDEWYRESAPVNWTQMSQVYEVLSQADPRNAEFAARKRYSDAQVHFENRRFQDAYNRYHESMKFKPNWVLALNGQAKVLIRSDSPIFDSERGIRAFEAAITADPQFIWSYKNLGEYYKQVSRWSDAVRYLSMASNLSPNRSSILTSLRDAERRLTAEAGRAKRRPTGR